MERIFRCVRVTQSLKSNATPSATPRSDLLERGELALVACFEQAGHVAVAHVPVRGAERGVALAQVVRDDGRPQLGHTAQQTLSGGVTDRVVTVVQRNKEKFHANVGAQIETACLANNVQPPPSTDRVPVLALDGTLKEKEDGSTETKEIIMYS